MYVGGNEVKKSTMLLIPALCFILICVLQAIFLGRYLDRFPHDWVGIGLSGAAITGFALTAIGFLIQWRRQKQAENRGLTAEEK
jgi:hypothetical protein